MVQLLYEGLLHHGMSFINVLSPCVTFHKDANKDYFKELSDEVPSDHDVSSFDAALSLLRHHTGRLPTGLIYRATNLPTFGEGIDANVRSTAGISERSIVESVLLHYR